MKYMKICILPILFILLGSIALAMTYCDDTCISKYANWTSYGTMTVAKPANESYIFNPTLDKIPELFNTGIDNRLIKLTISFDYIENDRHDIPQINDSIIIDSLNDGFPNFQFSTLNDTVCPEWNTDGTCTFYFEINKTYSSSSVRSEQLIVLGSSLNWYYTVGLNIYTPPEVISFIEVIGENGTISVGQEAQKMSSYISDFFTMAFELITILFWIILIMGIILAIYLIYLSVTFIYHWVKRQAK